MKGALISILGSVSPQVFYFLLVVAAIALVLGILSLLREQRGSDSNFRVRESDLRKSSTKIGTKTENDDLAHAKMKRHEPLRLEGIRIDGAPHEILGVAANADAVDVQKAYRALMKRYHPDKIGRVGSREWKDAQKIAEAINLAKDAMLKKRG